MTNLRKVVWIDDDPARNRFAAEVGADFIDVHSLDTAKSITKVINARPSLVILDQFLDRSSTSNRLFKRGSTIAEAIKEKWPACPVVGVTAQGLDKIDRRTKEAFDALFPIDDFRKYINQIQSIREGFAAAARTRAKSARKIIELLMPPHEELERLEAAIPDELKRDLDSSVPSLLHRWIDHLHERPGFLFNRLWTATTLGLKETGFDLVESEIEAAKYSGIFARKDEARWWSYRVTELIFEKCPPQPGEQTWHVGRRLAGIKKEHWSKCYRCKKEYPDTVAFLDEQSNEQHAAHLSCTLLHPRHTRELFFEDIRIMRGD